MEEITESRWERLKRFIRENRAPLLVALITIIFFWQTLVLSRTYFFGDNRIYYYPSRVFFGSALRAGQSPFWCRYLFSGFPLFADSESGIFYLPNFIGYYLPTLAAFNYSIFLHYLAMALFTYMYGRAIRLSKAASTFAALTFTFSGFSIAHLGHMNVLTSLAWFPLILYLVEKGLQRDSYAYFLGAGLVLGIQFLAGFLMIPLFVLTIAFFYVFCYPRPDRWSRRGLLRAAGMLVVLGGIGFGLGAVQNLPSYYLVNASVREGGLSTVSSNLFNFPPTNIISLVFPRFFGGPKTYYWGPWNFVELYAYVGILPLALAPVALFKNRTWHTKFYAWAGLTALVISFGEMGLLYTLVHKLPGYNVLKDPSRFVMIVDFALIMLAAIGLDRLLARREFGERNMRRLTRALAWAAGSIVAGIALIKVLMTYNVLGFSSLAEGVSKILFRNETHARGWSYYYNTIKSSLTLGNSALYVPLLLIAAVLGLLWMWRKGFFSRQLFVALVLVFTIFEIFYTGYDVNPLVSASSVQNAPALIRSIQEDQGQYRVALAKDPALKTEAYIYQPNELLTYGIEDARGYSSLAPARYNRFQDLINQTFNQSAMNLLNVRYFIATLTRVGERQFDTSRPIAFNEAGARADFNVGGFTARRLEMLSGITGGGPLAAGTVAAELYVQADGKQLGPYPIVVGEQTDQMEYQSFVSHGRLDRGSAPTVSYYHPGSVTEIPIYLGTIDLGETVDVDGVSLVMAPGLEGATFTVRGINLLGWSFRPVELGPVIYQESGSLVYRNPGELPRAFLVGNAVLAPDANASMDKLFKEGLDPGATVSLERGTLDAELEAKVAAWPEGRQVDGQVQLTEEDSGRITLEADAADDCVLVTSQAYFPGWTATMDGEPVGLYPAWGTLTALYLPKGVHHFELVYEPQGLLPGVLATLFVLAVVLVLLFVWRRRNKRRSGPPETEPVEEGGAAESAGPDPAEGGISVFFPAYNDEGSIEKMVRSALRVLAELPCDYEIWVIDDGSSDGTPAIADRLAAEDPHVNVIHHPVNRGYGGALKSGFAAARKGLVFYTDGDGQYDVSELKLLFEKRREADIVNGYKLRRTDPIYRKALGGAYNGLARWFFGIKIRDIDCDFRLMRTAAVQGLSLESEGGTICLEMVKKLQSRGFTFAEVPVHHYERRSGSSQFFRLKHLIKMFSELVTQWWKLEVKDAFFAERLNKRTIGGST